MTTPRALLDMVRPLYFSADALDDVARDVAHQACELADDILSTTEEYPELTPEAEAWQDLSELAYTLYDDACAFLDSLDAFIEATEAIQKGNL